MTIQLDTKAIIAIIGALTLVIGVFLPSLSMPLLGNLSYLDMGSLGSAGVLALAAVALGLTLFDRTRFVGMPGAIALVLVGHDYLRLQANLGEAQVELETRPEAASLGDFASAFNVAPSYGWVVLGLGAITLIVAPWLRLRPTISA